LFGTGLDTQMFCSVEYFQVLCAFIGGRVCFG
jgi:hypothetical protein